MSGARKINTKRTTLKKIIGFSAIATALPKSWVKPTINSVLLPAHAQTSTLPPTGTSLLHISSVLSNPVGGDCGASARELVSITNSGTAMANLSGLSIQRVLLSGPETLVSLMGTIAAGQTIDYDVCQGTSARLNNTLGGVVRLESAGTTIDIVQYPSIVNGPSEGTVVPYGPTPSSTLPRTS